jgi:hypothetical protein
VKRQRLKQQPSEQKIQMQRMKRRRRSRARVTWRRKLPCLGRAVASGGRWLMTQMTLRMRTSRLRWIQEPGTKALAKEGRSTV